MFTSPPLGNGTGTEPLIPFFLVAFQKKSDSSIPVHRVRNQCEPMPKKLEPVKI